MGKYVFLFGETMEKERAKLTNPVVLAFVGDAVFSLYVRTKLVCTASGKPNEYQTAGSKIVSAHAQSEFVDKILPILTDEEQEIYRRGRNAKKATKSKNAAAGEYNRSTGLEAVIGYLYFIGDEARLQELFSHLDEEKFKTVSSPTPFKPVR